MVLKFEVDTFDLFDMSRFAIVSTGWNTSSSATPVHAKIRGDGTSAALSSSRDAKKCVPEAPEPRTRAVPDSVLFPEKIGAMAVDEQMSRRRRGQNAIELKEPSNFMYCILRSGFDGTEPPLAYSTSELLPGRLLRRIHSSVDQYKPPQRARGAFIIPQDLFQDELAIHGAFTRSTEQDHHITKGWRPCSLRPSSCAHDLTSTLRLGNPSHNFRLCIPRIQLGRKTVVICCTPYPSWTRDPYTGPCRLPQSRCKCR